MSRLVLGLQPVREVIRAHGKSTEKVIVELSDSPQLAALVRFATDQGIAVERLPRATLDRMSAGVRHQGCAALAPELVMHALDDVLADDKALIIALDEIQDPQNFGAVVRCAVAICGATILWPENSSAPLTPTTFRASAGAIEHAKLVRVKSLRTALSTCAEAGASLVALEARAPSLLSEVNLRGPTVLMVGSEGFGLRKGTRALATIVARLPMTGTIDSLNASAAASIALYEAARQRTITGA